MKLTERINFRQPKYMLPAIVYLPLLGASYFIFDLFDTKVAEKKDANMQTTEYLNPNLPQAHIKGGDGIGGKYENMLNAYGKIEDHSAVENIDRDNEQEKEEYQSKYSDAELQQLDAEAKRQAELEKTREAQEAHERQRENEALAELNKALAEARLKGQQATQQNSSSSATASDETTATAKGGINIEGKIKVNENARKEADENDKPSEVVKKVKTSSDYFNTLAVNEKEPTMIKAIIDENVKAVDGSRVRLRLLDDVEIGEMIVKKGAYLYATMSGFGSQRVKGSINSILVDDEHGVMADAGTDDDGVAVTVQLQGHRTALDQQRRGKRSRNRQCGYEHPQYWQQFFAVGHADHAECLSENKQCHRKGNQEEQGETEIWHLCVSDKLERYQEQVNIKHNKVNITSI